MQPCSVLGAPRGLKKGSSTQRRLECPDGSFVAAAFVGDFEVEGEAEQRGEPKPLTELVLEECNSRGKFSSKNKLSEPALSLVPCLSCLCNLSCSPVSWIYQDLFIVVSDTSFEVVEGNRRSFNMLVSWASLLSEEARAACWGWGSCKAFQLIPGCELCCFSWERISPLYQI